MLAVRRPGVERGGVAVLVEHRPVLVRDVIGLQRRLFGVFRRTQAVASEILEQRAAGFGEVDVPGLAPGHDLLRQHVVHHHRHDAEHLVAAPEPLIDPLLHDRQVVGVLLEQELDDLDAERHVAAFVRLRREAEGDGRHVAVVGRARHERNEQEVGQQVFEGEADRDHELERTRGAGVVEERLRHAEVPDAVMHVRELGDPVEELVVVADGVDLRLDMAQFVERLLLRRDTRADAAQVPAGEGESAVRLIFLGRDAGEEQLDDVGIAAVRDLGLAVVLGEGVQARRRACAPSRPGISSRRPWSGGTGLPTPTSP